MSLSASASGGSGSLVYSFGIKGSWSEIRGYASPGAATWNTTGLAPGTYVLSVRAKSQDSSAAFDAERDISYTIQPPPCGNGSIGEWSSCSTSCGGGTQLRTITRPDCSTYTESQACNTQACVSSGIVATLPPPPTVSVWFDPPVYSDTQKATTFYWSVSNADTCTFFYSHELASRQFTINPKLQPQGSSRWGAAANLSSITAGLTCTGPGGSTTAQSTAVKNVSPVTVVTQTLPPPQCVVAKSSYPAAGSIINENAPLNVCTEGVDSSCANPGMRCVLIIGYMGF